MKITCVIEASNDHKCYYYPQLFQISHRNDFLKSDNDTELKSFQSGSKEEIRKYIL